MLDNETIVRNSNLPVMDGEDMDVFAQTNPSSSKYVIAADAPVLPSMASRGNTELVVKDDGMSMVLFNFDLPDAVHWVEYDMDVDSLTFVTWRGAIFSLGMKIHKPFRKYLSKRHEMHLIQMNEAKDIEMMDIIPMVVRRIGI